ncbi:uncharacterized protein DUF4827 [Bacteroides zoogleoformans]|uniref:DUF4827 domain-containing protein n=1 Tax=Bacteroides zoogleoformans TaxID=28119 RepID=A0ABN5IK67_9BACE|nr:DUF4827 domain-containing protein [Bacteroides zoogleoformans]AVM53249.1 DUF4827 domain-containing protein [Bacteroides zoogleoformans]TWJ11141.1 uncharacterized protein DUF4827 [Bacteroides zoogleoformans]
MKKLTLFFFALFALGLAFQACDNTKTYAEMLEDEKNAIKAFIKDSNIVVISQSEFYAQDSTTDVSKNEYVQLASGVYMQIVDKGSANPADSIKPNDLILVRFEEHGLMAVNGSKSYLSNLSEPTIVDEFRYTVTSSSIAGLFIQGYMRASYGTSVPAGWLVALSYVRDGAHVKLIVPSKMGQRKAMQQVYPYFYDIHKFQVWN